MTIYEIDKLISEYAERLSEVKAITKPGRKYKKWIPKAPIHLREFYISEIQRLSKEKVFLINTSEYSIEVKWENILFDDGCIRIKINQSLSEPFRLKYSRKSFEYIRSFIFRNEVDPLQVVILGNKIIRVNNIEVLNSVISIFSLQEEISLSIDNNNKVDVDRVLSRLSNIGNYTLIKLLNISDRSKYIKYLCDQQNDKFGIIPVLELINTYDENVRQEDTFLFTIKKDNDIYIIWESTFIGRATHIFRTRGRKYKNDIQLIFDFISTQQRAKRRNLRLTKKLNNQPLPYIGAIEHATIVQWKKRLMNLLISLP